jgi:hypothetical protein
MDTPLSPLALASRMAVRWGPFSIAVIIGSLTAAYWAETMVARSPGVADDTVITGSVKPTQPRQRTTRIIHSVLDDKPIVIRE